MKINLAKQNSDSIYHQIHTYDNTKTGINTILLQDMLCNSLMKNVTGHTCDSPMSERPKNRTMTVLQ